MVGLVGEESPGGELRTISLADATEMDSPSAMRGIGTGSGCPASTARHRDEVHLLTLRGRGEFSFSCGRNRRCLGMPEHRT